MKKFLSFLLCILIISTVSCTENKLEDKPQKIISMPKSQSRSASLQVEKRKDELTILYPYMTYRNEYIEIFKELNGLCREKLDLSINLLTPDSSGLEVSPLQGEYFYIRSDYYSQTLKSLMNAGLGPDIFFTAKPVDELLRHYYRANNEQYGLSNDLLTMITSGYASDITSYINDQTPFLLHSYINNGNLQLLTEYKGRTYGIMAPPSYKDLPVFIIKRNLNMQLENKNHTTLQDAINACIEINEKALLTQYDRIFLNPHYVFDKIVFETGFYQAFESLGLMYFFKQEDHLYTLYRIEDTPILDEIKKYRNLFKDGSISTRSTDLLSKQDPNEEFVAGLTSYKSFLISQLDQSAYDITFIEDIPVDSRDIYNIFVVNSNCVNKQGAVQFIDFIFSDPEANFLMKYGLENETYQIHPDMGVMVADKTDLEAAALSVATIMTGHTVLYDVATAEYILCNHNQKQLTERYINNTHVVPLLDLVINSPANKGNRTVLEAIDELFWSLKNPDVPATKKEDWLIGDDEILGRTVLPYIFEDKTNPYKYSYEDIVLKILDTRNDDLIKRMQDIIDEYLCNRNP